jgi:hypothetical protein
LEHMASLKRFSFLILDSRWDSLDGGSARRKAATHTQTQNERRQTSCLEWDSNLRSQLSSERRTFHALDRAATVIGFKRICT